MRPTGVVLGILLSRALFDDGEVGRVGKAESAIEGREVANDGGIIEGIDDGDGLAGAVPGDIAEADVAEAIGGAHLGRREPDRKGIANGLLHWCEVRRQRGVE